MNITDAVHDYIRLKIDDIVKQNDAEMLCSMLKGDGLPALGDDREPAEKIIRAIETTPRFAERAACIADMLPRLLNQSAEEFEKRLASASRVVAGGTVVVGYTEQETLLDDERYVLNMFMLASMLPRRQGIFEELFRFYEKGLKSHVLIQCHNRAALQLRFALSEQQTNHQIDDYWLELLRPKTDGWDYARRSELIDAWRGILNICDLEGDLNNSLELIDKALRLFHDSVVKHAESIKMLELAFWQMETAWPLDPATWASYLKHYAATWPELLQDVAVIVWHKEDFAQNQQQNDLLDIPDNLKPLWDAIKDDDRSMLQRCFESQENEKAAAFIRTLWFSPPEIAGMPKQQVRSLLNSLSKLFEISGSKAKDVIKSNVPGNKDDDEPRERKQYIRTSFDRLNALQTINNVLDAIGQQLKKGDEGRARKYLSEIVESQRSQPTTDKNIHIAKTLSKAASIAIEYGFLGWAEELLQQSCSENTEDAVSANGLADVLKAQGRLPEAETAYRSNVIRWPNNEVSANGLADVLKAQGRLPEAETAYRNNVTRWPNDEVSANGLADVLKAQGRLPEAEAVYRNNMTRWPNNAVSACGLADVLKAQGRLSEAETAYRSNVIRWPNDEVSANGLADVLKAQGRLSEAEIAYRNNIIQWPNNAVSTCGLADVLKAQGRLSEAEAVYRNNMTRWPNDRIAANGLANVLRKLKRYEEALALLPAPVDHKQYDLYDLHLRAVILSDMNRFDEARDLFIQGSRIAISEISRRYFQRGLVVLEIRAQKFDNARRLLDDMPSDITPSVTPLNLYRLHIEAVQQQTSAVMRLRDGLRQIQPFMTYMERQTLALIEKVFSISDTIFDKQFSSDIMDLYEAEVELALAA